MSQTLTDWINTTGAEQLRRDGVADYRGTTSDGERTDHGIMWDTTGDWPLAAYLTGPGISGRGSEPVVRAVDNDAEPEHYASAMRVTAEALADATVRMILDLDAALTAAVELIGVSEEIGTHGALLRMCRRRLGEPARVTFVDDHVQR